MTQQNSALVERHSLKRILRAGSIYRAIRYDATQAQECNQVTTCMAFPQIKEYDPIFPRIGSIWIKLTSLIVRIVSWAIGLGKNLTTLAFHADSNNA